MRRSQRTSIDRRIGAYFDIILNDHAANLGKFHLHTSVKHIAESIAANYDARVERASVSDCDARVQHNHRIKDGSCTKDAAFPDSDAGMQDAASANPDTGSYVNSGADINRFANFGRRSDNGRWMPKSRAQGARAQERSRSGKIHLRRSRKDCVNRWLERIGRGNDTSGSGQFLETGFFLFAFKENQRRFIGGIPIGYLRQYPAPIPLIGQT